MSLTDIDAPELQSITIRLPGSNTEFSHFLAYSYDENFLTPSDAFWFDLDEDELSSNDKLVLIPGAGVEVSIQGHRQCSGLIDSITASSGRSGTTWHIECRDWLSPSVDGHIDPTKIFPPTLSVQDFLTEVFDDFGVTAVADDNFANRNIVTGRVYGTKSAKSGTLLKSAVSHQTKPYPNEGAFGFAARIVSRLGAWLWPSQDAYTLQCGVPNFDQEPRYQLQHKEGATSGGSNNIISAEVTQSRRDQPSVIVGFGVGGGGEFAKTSLRAIVVNPLVNADNSAVFAAYPNVPPVKVPPIPAASPSLSGTFIDPNARPLFVYDSESHNLNELEHFMLRELGRKMCSSLTASFTVVGHRLNKQPIAVDSIVRVEDDRSNLHMNLWVMGRRFEKRAGEAGTTTRISCIRPGTLVF